MTWKRRFLSENGRWTVSVWNKGKTDKGGRAVDGGGPAWTVYHDGGPVAVQPVPNTLGIEIGILDMG
jgi:hypothetical protein